MLSLVVLCMKSSSAFSQNLDFWKAALIKPVLEGETALIKSVLEGDHSKEGLTLELQVQTLWASFCEMSYCSPFAMCNHHH